MSYRPGGYLKIRPRDSPALKMFSRLLGQTKVLGGDGRQTEDDRIKTI